MKRVLVVCPTQREYRYLPAIAQKLNYKLLFDEFGGDYFDNPLAENDSEHTPDMDVLALIEDLVKRYEAAGLSGVASAVGYPGMSVASIAAQRLGLPGPSINCILLCEHKYYSRLAQKALVPAATPSFQILDGKAQGQLNQLGEFPLFVKPVKANFSINAGRVSTEDKLRRTLRPCSLLERFLKPFNDLLAAYTDYQYDASHLLAETLLEGTQVSLEGYAYKGKAHIIGIVDALMYPGTISFERFVYPSRLSEDVQRRMADIAEAFINGIGYDNAFFNVEMMYNPMSDRISIIEVNPKIASQFTDLFEKVDGTSTYAPLLQIAAGDEPVFPRRQGEFKMAASCVLRTFENKRVLAVPSSQQIDNLLARFADARIEVCAFNGQLLSDGMQDGKSYRYGLINIGADSDEELNAKLDVCRSLLDFQFAPV
ncbi:MAG TPA: ATP-grasp domain-containing protein [Pyrinomonadaceae bacterium]|jgi:biotin carboxylase